MTVFSLLNNLGARYESFTTLMLKPPMLSYVEILPLLQGYEIRTSLHDSNSYFAFYGQRTGAPASKDHCGGGQGFHPASHSAQESHTGTPLGARSSTCEPNDRPITTRPLTYQTHVKSMVVVKNAMLLSSAGTNLITHSSLMIFLKHWLP